MLLRLCRALSIAFGLAAATAACGSGQAPVVPEKPEPSANPGGASATAPTSAASEGGAAGDAKPGGELSNPPPGATSTAAPASSASGASSAATPGSPSSPADEPPPIPPNTVVLHIGDSFLQAGFAQAIKPRMKALGVRYEIRSEQSSYTTTWAGKMEQLIRETQPDLVIINLGANEISNTDPPTHASAVRRIIKGIGGRPCVWVSPPSWRKDTGIINVIRENSAPCRYFDSDLLVTQPIPRGSDKIHPTIAGGAIWAAAFWDWLHAQRVPAGADGGAGGPKRNPWLLKPSPPEEHAPREYTGPRTSEKSAK